MGKSITEKVRGTKPSDCRTLERPYVHMTLPHFLRQTRQGLHFRPNPIPLQNLSSSLPLLRRTPFSQTCPVHSRSLCYVLRGPLHGFIFFGDVKFFSRPPSPGLVKASLRFSEIALTRPPAAPTVLGESKSSKKKRTTVINGDSRRETHGHGRINAPIWRRFSSVQSGQMSPSDFPFPVHGLCGRKILESVAAESPALSIRLLNGSEERSQGYYYMNNDATFDSNLVIILAALLCSLMCALGLSSMVRCALRCSRGLMFESPESAAVRLANTGLKKATVRALPTVVYGLGSRVGAECPICLAEFVEGENVRVLPHCNHGFHVACIDTWLRSHSSCPTCRRNLLVAMAKRSSRDSLPTRRTAESSDTSAASGSSLPPSDADVEAGIVGEHPAS